MKRIALSILLVCLFQTILPAQSPDLVILKNARRIEIPFEYENSFIVARVVFNSIFPLKFIIDTGAEHTILTKREITDLLQIDYQRRFVVVGADLETELVAFLVRGINLNVGNMLVKNRSILVLEEDYFKFEEVAGLDVHGIIGADLLRRFVVRIDYKKQVITLMDPSTFEPPGGRFKEIPMEINRNKPYIDARTELPGDTAAQLKYLIDTGASLAMMIYTTTDSVLHLPEHVIRSRIGMGLGGYIEGFIGRIPYLEFGEFEMRDVVTNFQEVTPTMDSSYFNNRNGLIGNQILSRFTVILDYIQGRVYMAPNRNYKKKFKYDRSGLSLAASGASLEDFMVINVVPDSPADEAGIQRGDIIKKINGLPSDFMTLHSVLNRLKKRPGKRIRMTVLRGEEKIKVSFRLRDLI